MQPERQISLAGILVGASLILPEAGKLYAHADAVASGGYFAGGLIGAVGVIFGALVVLDEEGSVLAVFGGLLTLIELALLACMLLAAYRDPSWTWRVLFTLAGLLPLLLFGFGALLLRARRRRQLKTSGSAPPPSPQS